KNTACCPAGPGGSGWIPCRYNLAAALLTKHSRVEYAQYRVVLVRRHPGSLFRIRDGGLPDRCDWTKADPDIVCRLLLFCGDLLLRLSYLEPSDARARIPPG